MGAGESLPEELRKLNWDKAALGIDSLVALVHGTPDAPQVHPEVIKSDSPGSNWLYLVRDHSRGVYVSAILPPENQDNLLPYGSSIHMHPKGFEYYSAVYGEAYINQKLPKGWHTTKVSTDGKSLTIPPDTLHTAIGWRTPAVLAIQISVIATNGRQESHSHVYDGKPQDVFRDGWYYPEPGILRQKELLAAATAARR